MHGLQDQSPVGFPLFEIPTPFWPPSLWRVNVGWAAGVAKVGFGHSAVDVLKMEVHLFGYLLPSLPSDLSGSFSSRRRHMGPLREGQSTSGNHVAAVDGDRLWSPPSVERKAVISS
ncbi:unnamed protein product [Spirodela intermedia]|uniref:Uncharacterized protein n=1 Tax=Spirodela intermedia TaxID=51605 RepID=A0A7I8IQX7_SPIIN|nr:unnamed protein product [Spirodela intermedia]CAA6660378.1 unnamed protein product [Spirodela intermedia]